MPNKLAAETSPYLLQHADNPVDWWPWGPEAFAEARRRDVPILLSVGYSACHWCHVMAHESFENADAAAVMNEFFVSIKVDREERPDVDAVYMEATQAMTGHGGWPMTVFMTADGEPFFCGTYYPPADRHGMPGFPRVLLSVAQAWRDRRDELTEAAKDIVSRLGARSPSATGTPMTAAVLDAAAEALGVEYDEQLGGFGRAPKFPPSMCLEFLLRHHARTASPTSLAMVAGTAERMARGGLYDQLGGGFARYSVDAAWVVPHFEKMLYDNALLLRAYLHWYRATGDGLALRVVRETAGFLLRDLRTDEGGFASALDADSEGEEGKYYVWTPEQLADVLGEADGAWAAQAWAVGPAGTFEHGASVLQRLDEPADLERYEHVRAALHAFRTARRVPPGRDDKVVSAWNGLAIAALAEAGALLDDAEMVAAAVGAAELLQRLHWSGGRLLRTSLGGRAGRHAGVLEDYADLAEGLLALFSATGDGRWTVWAQDLLEVVLDHFADPVTGELYDTAADAERLVRRPQDPTDNATPSGPSAAAGALLSYAALTGSARHRAAAEAVLAAAAPLAGRHARFFGHALAVGEALAAGPVEVAVVGPAGDPATAELLAVARRSTAPGLVLAWGGPSGEPAVALLKDRPLLAGRPAAYVCRGFVCRAPSAGPEDLARSIALT